MIYHCSPLLPELALAALLDLAEDVEQLVALDGGVLPAAETQTGAEGRGDHRQGLL